MLHEHLQLLVLRRRDLRAPPPWSAFYPPFRGIWETFAEGELCVVLLVGRSPTRSGTPTRCSSWSSGRTPGSFFSVSPLLAVDFRRKPHADPPTRDGIFTRIGDNGRPPHDLRSPRRDVDQDGSTPDTLCKRPQIGREFAGIDTRRRSSRRDGDGTGRTTTEPPHPNVPLFAMLLRKGGSGPSRSGRCCCPARLPPSFFTPRLAGRAPPAKRLAELPPAVKRRGGPPLCRGCSAVRTFPGRPWHRGATPPARSVAAVTPSCWAHPPRAAGGPRERPHAAGILPRGTTGSSLELPLSSRGPCVPLVAALINDPSIW